MKKRSSRLKKQSGVILVVSLVMLLLLTLIGMTGAQVTSLEEKMAGNVRDKNVAFQAAEATLLAAERFILNNPTGSTTYPDVAGGALLGMNVAEPTDYFDASNWTGGHSSTTDAGFGANFGLPSEPRYIIKKIFQNGAVNTFRITARATGKNPGTQVILQEIYQRNN